MPVPPNYDSWRHVEIKETHYLTRVEFPELLQADDRTPPAPAKLTFTNPKDGTSGTLSVAVVSLDMLRSADSKTISDLTVALANESRKVFDREAEIRRLNSRIKELERANEELNFNNRREVASAERWYNEAVRLSKRIDEKQAAIDSLERGRNQTIKALETDVERLKGEVNRERDIYSAMLNKAEEYHKKNLAEVKKQLAAVTIERDKLREQYKYPLMWTSGKTTFAAPLPHIQKGVEFTALTPRLDSLEKRVETLEKSYYPTITFGKSEPVQISNVEITINPSHPEDGYPIETAPTGEGHCLLLMGGRWVKGVRSSRNPNHWWSSGEDSQWDNENQPTRWKPLPIPKK